MKKTTKVGMRNLNTKVIQSSCEAKGVIVCLHGGPGGDLNGNTDVFNQIAEIASPLGYHIIQFDFWGSGESSKHVEEQTLETQIQDAKTIVKFARDKFDLPVVICGESAGVTIDALEWVSDASAHILLWPAFDLKDTDLRVYFSEEWQEKVKQEEVLRDGDFVIGKDMYWEMLRTDYSDCFQLPDTPIFLAHGTQDEEVPFEQTLEAMKSCKNDCDVLILKDAGHGFKKSSCRKQLLNRLSNWLENLE